MLQLSQRKKATMF